MYLSKNNYNTVCFYFGLIPDNLNINHKQIKSNWFMGLVRRYKMEAGDL